uniref:Putative methyltransferase n=1 Tax=viral metagenome TaxID=1070528 RepID=A0A6M3MG97_9ZZZZ
MSKYYDDVFKRSSAYRCPPEESPYYPLWTAVLSLIKHPTKILDVGCGPGQFAALCVKAGHEYVGLDWSRVAVDIGREGPGEFHLVDVQQDRARFKDDYDVITFIEFLEHVPDDLEILADVPQRRTIILTVPDYPGAEHFRHFSDLGQATRRYQSLVTVSYRMVVSGKNLHGGTAKIFILKGTRR